MKLIKTALVILSKIRSLVVIRDNTKQCLVDNEIGSIMQQIREHYPVFLIVGKDTRVIRTTREIELDFKQMSLYKQSFRTMGIALLNATPEMQADGYNMFLRFGNNMLPVKVYKQVHIGRGQQCRMLRPAI